jgi:alpha-tubulin suppressor-like RCC1 family protein
MAGFKAAAFGYDFHYELGLGYKTPSNTEPALIAHDEIVQTVHYIFAMALLLADGTVRTVGNSQHSQLCSGIWQAPPFPHFQKAIELAGVTALAACGGHPMALLSSGGVRTWGTNHYGLNGIGVDPVEFEGKTAFEGPRALEGMAHRPVTPLVGGIGGTPLANIVAVDAGEYHNLALDATGKIFGWGNCKAGQLGTAFAGEEWKNAPVLVTLGIPGTPVAVAAGHKHTLVLMSNGTVGGFGDSQAGQLGTGHTGIKEPPALVPGISDAIAIAAGGNHSHIVKADGSIWSCGDNSSGQLGIGTKDSEDHTAFVKTHLPAGSPAASYLYVSNGGTPSDLGCGMAICSGKLFTWGSNRYAQLGYGKGGPAQFRATPSEVPLPSAALSCSGSESGTSVVLAGAAPTQMFMAEAIDGEKTLLLEWDHPELPGQEWQALVSPEPTEEEDEKEEEPPKSTIKLGPTAQSFELPTEPGRGYHVTIRQTGKDSTWAPKTIDSALLPGFAPFLIEKPPKMFGTLVVGETLTAQQGWWARATTGFSFRWLRNGLQVGTARTYTLTAEDAGKHLALEVTATNSHGSTVLTTAALRVPSIGEHPTHEIGSGLEIPFEFGFDITGGEEGGEGPGEEGGEEPPPELPTVGPGAEELYRRLGPLTAADHENGFYVLHRCEAISLMWQGFDQIVQDTDTHPGWTTVVDPDAAPTTWLEWCAKAVYGVTLADGLSAQQQRDRIRELPPQLRGGVAVMLAAVAQTLTGAKHVSLNERPGSEIYAEFVVTRTSETPDPVETLAAVKGQKIGGVKQLYAASEVWYIAELERAYASFTIAEFEAAFASVQAVEEHGVI